MIKISHVRALSAEEEPEPILKRLKELVPVYIVALFSSVITILDLIAAINLLVAQIFVGILIIIAVIVTYYYEKIRMNVDDKWQIIITMISGGLWLLAINSRFFPLGDIFELSIRFVAAVWTWVIMLFFK
ncbi:MAG: hypothetical protein ACFFDN_20440 [Candidatus Hodarchaeota archaeon]